MLLACSVRSPSVRLRAPRFRRFPCQSVRGRSLSGYLKTADPYVYVTGISGQSAAVTVEIPIQNGCDTNMNVTVQAQILDREGNPAESVSLICRHVQVIHLLPVGRKPVKEFSLGRA